MCDAIYIDTTQQTLKEIMDGHFSNLLRLLKNGQQSHSFSTHFDHNFNVATSCIDLRKYMTFKVVKYLNPIGAMNFFMKPNGNLCMEEHLTILKKLRENCVTIMSKSSDIYGAYRHKTTFR